MVGLVVALGAAACPGGPAKGPGPLWASDEAAAFAQARREDKAVLVLLTARWSTPAQELSAWLDRPAVRAELAPHFVGWRVDVTAGDDVASAVQERFAAPSVPTLLFVEPDGRVAERYTDSFDEPAVRAAIARARAHHAGGPR